MNLTAKIHKVFDEDVRSTGGSWVRAIASVNIGNDFVVHGVKVLAGTNGDTVVMPATKYKDKYQDTFHPINRKQRTNHKCGAGCLRTGISLENRTRRQLRNREHKT